MLLATMIPQGGTREEDRNRKSERMTVDGEPEHGKKHGER
jgi:hypothetical protein